MEVNLQKLADFGKGMFKKYPYTEYANELRLDDEVYALFGYVTQIRDLTNDMVDDIEEMVAILNEFIREYDTELEQKVIKTLKEWQKTGLLEVIIQEGLQTQMDGIELRLDNSVTNEEFQLWAQTISSGTPNLYAESVADLLVKYPDGAAGIALVKDSQHKYIWNGGAWKDFGVYDGNYIPDNSVSVDKTNFIKVGKNWFNEATMKSGYYGTDGDYYPEESYRYSEIMVVEAGQHFVFSKNIAEDSDVRGSAIIGFITAYDDEKALPVFGGRNVSEYTVETGVTRIRISGGINHFNFKLQMELGTTATPYESYRRSIRYLHSEVGNEDILKQSIETTKLKLPEGTLPTTFKFVNGTLNSGVFSPVSSTRVASRLMYFAPAGSKVIASNPDTQFTIHILTEDGVYIRNTNWSNETYQFELDSYFRIAQRFEGETKVRDSDWETFNNSLLLSSNYPHSLSIKGDVPEGGAGGLNGKKIILPPVYPVVVGEEVNVYLDNILQHGNAYTAENFTIRANGAGEIIEYGYQFKGVADRTLTFDYGDGNQQLLSGSLPVKVVSKSSGSGTKKVMIIGESTTKANSFLSALLEKHSSDVTKVTLMGSKGESPLLSEGYPGWRISNLVSSLTYKDDTNTFYNPATNSFDFSYYMNKQGYSSVDIVHLNFGINDMADGQTVVQTLANYKKVVDSIHSYNANIKIAIGLTNLPSRHANENGNILKNKLLSLIEGLITTYGGRESEGLFLTPIYLNIDPVWDMKVKTVAISSRNNKEVVIGNDLVHPDNASGYLKQADTLYNQNKYIASKG